VIGTEVPMKKLFSSIIIFGLLISLVPYSIHAENGAEAGISRERYIVFFTKKVDKEAIELLGGKIIQEFPLIKAVTVEAQPSTVPDITKLPFFEKITKELPVRVESQNILDSKQVVPWSHPYLNLQAKKPATLTGKGIKVAVIDSGIATDHPDLDVKGGECVLDEEKACDQGFNDNDVDGHGTHVAGIIAALDNGFGVAGVASGAELYAVKALDSEGEGTSTTIMAGIQWAVENKMDIINLSLTTPYNDFGIKKMIDLAVENDILVIAAAGNDGDAKGKYNTVRYPAKYANVLAVSATNKSDVRISISSTGYEIDLAAPGEDILSTVPGGYATMRGTSMAAPHVAGLAALYMERYPEATAKDIWKLLEKNALDIGPKGRDTFYGAGLAQIDATIESTIDISVPGSIGKNGTVTLDMNPFLEKYQAYNIYRFDSLIVKNGTVDKVVDYAGQGRVHYKIHPIVNGVEQQNNVISQTLFLKEPYFSDMENDLWYNRYLVYLHGDKILNGYSGSRLKPTQLVTRAEAVTMLGRALGLDGSTRRPTRFTDVPKASFASGYIEAAAEAKIISGRVDGTFRPDQPVTRAEMAILLARAYKLQPAADITFLDVNSRITGNAEISAIAGASITAGYADGTFRPSETMNRASFAVFLAKAQNNM
jgi:subtilisin